MDRKAISERLETFSNEKYHIEMQNTPPKQENNIISMAQKTENQPFLPKFYTTFRTTHEHIFLYHRLWYFIQISYLSKFRATLFGISRFCTKCEACFSPTDSRWGRQISADNLTLIFNLNNFTHNPRAHILYHRLWYFIQIPYLSKFRATLFGISRFVQNVKHALIMYVYLHFKTATSSFWLPLPKGFTQ